METGHNPISELENLGDVTVHAIELHAAATIVAATINGIGLDISERSDSDSVLTDAQRVADQIEAVRDRS